MPLGFRQRKDEPIQSSFSDCAFKSNSPRHETEELQQIDSSSEVIFLDEAYANLLDIDDWKIIFQGASLPMT